MMHRSPVDPDRYIGTVTVVTATSVQANMPQAAAHPEQRALAKGAVSDFVFVDCEAFRLLGRIIEVRIPDGERLSVEPKLGQMTEPNPIGRIQLLATVEQGSNKLRRGLTAYPKIGDAVYLADPDFLSQLIQNSVARAGEQTLTLGHLDAGENVEIRLPPEKVFGRHTGVFGATGGGKSWTVATLIEQIKKARGKAIIFDPTGEFSAISSNDEVFSFGAVAAPGKQVHFPYRKATEDDMFSLFRPSGQSQGPKLRDAIKSLKLVNVMGRKIEPGVTCANGLIEKQDKPRAAFFAALEIHSVPIHSPGCDFDIAKLGEQIKNECIWQSGRPGTNFGGPHDQTVGYCETIISRISTLISSTELECLFKTQGTSLVDELDDFLSDDTKDIATISFKDVSFEHHTREILLNIIGRYILGLARSGRFKTSPLVVFLDEAHQFLGKTLGDEYGTTRLDSFGVIAKEGRKYGLTCVLATQRPRDIPQDIISQLGTLFVHRLTNHQDRETVEAACGDLDRGAAQFIPTLSPGEVVLIGPDLPAPVPIKMNPPMSVPDSKGPMFQAYWERRKTHPVVKTKTASPISVTQPLTPTIIQASAKIDDLDDEIPF